MRCTQCNAENPEHARFCWRCGAKLPEVCPRCNALLLPQARYCSECGAEVGATPPPGIPPSPSAPGFLTDRLLRLVPQEYADRLVSTRGQVPSERRLVTILFSDVKGSTAMAEALDPEDVMEIMSGAFDLLIEPVVRHEGTVARLMGDAVLAFFGAPLSHEDDAQRACLTALDIVAGIRRYAARLEEERGLRGFDVRVGINTGLVVVGEVGSDLRVEYTAMGDAINLAARLEQNAPPGNILISHDTYRHVRAEFDLVPQEPLAVKGKAEPVQTYVVERARPRAFRRGRRGVEGIETRTVGRNAEMARLQKALHTVVEQGECQVVTIVGEAGVGKSRLLDEFDHWTELQPEDHDRFQGRVDREMRHQPYALLRSLFSFRFGIQESDAAAVAREKLVRGLAAGLRAAQAGTGTEVEMKAYIAGQLLGFDFSASPHVQAIGQDAQQLRDRGLIYIGDYLRAMAAQRPLLVLLEDLHWADDSSLDAVERLAASFALGAAGPSPVLVLCAARPSLYERRPEWGARRDFFSQLDLSPLSQGDSRRLVEEILQRMEEVPKPLRDLVVTGAEGNPFFLEELIKMLVEEGVIRKGERAWSVDSERLGDLQVPPTLTGVLQARLDRLPFDQRQVLQEASVVGRLFWDLAVAYIAAAETKAGAETEADAQRVDRALAALQGREMVFPQATSAIVGAHEYLFKHALLREVTYEGVLKRVRRVYHGLVAEWMMAQTGEREREYTGLLADHLALAGRTEEAAIYLRRAAEQAVAAYANAEAVSYYTRALELTPEKDAAERYTMRLAREGLYELLGATEEWGQDIAALEALAEELDRAQEQAGQSKRAEAALRRATYEHRLLNTEAALVAVRAAVRLAREAQDLRCEADARTIWGDLLSSQGEYEIAHQRFEQALALARECGARDVEAACLYGLGWVFERQGVLYPAAPRSYWEGALGLYQQCADRRGEAAALGGIGVELVGTGDLRQAREYYERARDIYREIGDLPSEAGPVANMAWIYWAEDDYAGARACLEQALAITREVGQAARGAFALMNIGETVAAQGLYALGEAHVRQALPILHKAGWRTTEGRAILALGLIHYHQGDYAQAWTFLEESWRLSHDRGWRWVASKGLAALGLISLAQGDDEAARDFAQRALENGPADYHLGTGDSALVLGHALAGLGDRAGATAAYRQALDRYRRSGFLNSPMEGLAGLARVALAQGEKPQALEHVEAILDHLQSHTLDGTYQPFRIRLTCYQVLRANDDPRAEEVLRTACNLLQERAAMIEDDHLRRWFLEEVPWHRELVQEGEQASPG
jgi:class 3 adenylate cyclase/tetratricopeptide (TPR) repeat protein/ribosomal protein L40E